MLFFFKCVHAREQCIRVFMWHLSILLSFVCLWLLVMNTHVGVKSNIFLFLFLLG